MTLIPDSEIPWALLIVCMQTESAELLNLVEHGTLPFLTPGPTTVNVTLYGLQILWFLFNLEFK